MIDRHVAIRKLTANLPETERSKAIEGLLTHPDRIEALLSRQRQRKKLTFPRPPSRLIEVSVSITDEQYVKFKREAKRLKVTLSKYMGDRL